MTDTELGRSTAKADTGTGTSFLNDWPAGFINNVPAGLINGGLPPSRVKTRRNSFDGQWASKLRFNLWQQSESLSAAERDSNEKCCLQLVEAFFDIFTGFGGSSRSAVVLGYYRLARSAVPLRRAGRPLGARNHQPKYPGDQEVTVQEAVTMIRRESLDRRWARNLRHTLWREEQSIPDEVLDEIDRAREAVISVFIHTALPRLSPIVRMAFGLACYDAACLLDLPDRSGRPRGSGPTRPTSRQP